MAQRVCLAVLLAHLFFTQTARAQVPQITNAPNTLVTIYTFTGTNGETPEDNNGLLRYGTNYLLGTTSAGGKYGAGVAFKISLTGSLVWETSFDGTNGAEPTSGVISSGDGNYYGTTYSGGADDDGVIFRVSPAGVLSTLYSFSGDGPAGMHPLGGLVLEDGVFVGAAEQGGSAGEGTAYDVTSYGAAFNLYSFTGDFGEAPVTTLCTPASGGSSQLLFGTTSAGGSGTDGVLYDLNFQTREIVVFHEFSGGDGIDPRELYLSTSGTIYGMTHSGGTNGGGTIFAARANGGGQTLVELNTFTGTAPQSGFIQGSDGYLYGTASQAGENGWGTVFRMPPDGSSISILVSLSGTGGPYPGKAPYGALVEGFDHNFYGTTTKGGALDEGTVFRLERRIYVVQIAEDVFYPIAATNNPTHFSATDLPPGLTIDPTSGFLTGTATVSGTFAVTFSARNAHGTGSAPLTIIVAPEPLPAITSATTVTGTGDYAFIYQIDASNNPTSYAAQNLPAGLAVDPSSGLISGTPTVFGTFNATISAINFSGTTSAPLAIDLSAPPAPAISGPLQASGTGDYAFSYQINLGGYAADFTAGGLPAGVTLNPSTGLISGTPTQTGSFSVPLGAVNLGGSTSAILAIFIAVPPPPTITGDLTATGNLGIPFDYQIETAANANNYQESNLPAGLSLDASTGLISGTPTQTGTYQAGITSINLGGTDTGMLTITIDIHPPIIGGSLAATGTIGQAFSYQISATDNPAGYEADGLPAGLSVDNSIGLISGTPAENGTFGVVLTSTNVGGPGVATLELTVNATFTQVAGAYQGLGALDGTNVGMTSFTLARTGAFSGRLTLASTAYPMVGKFNPDGIFAGSSTVGRTSLAMNLALNQPAKTIGGTLAVTSTSGTMSYTLQAQALGVFNPRTSPVVAAGRYTFVAPLGGSNGMGAYPQYPGYGTLTVTPTGTVVLSGKLGDTTPIAIVSHVHADGKTWTLFDRVYAGREAGTIAGNITFESQSGSDADGMLDWIKPPQVVTAGNYLQGFDNLTEFMAAKYQIAPFTPGMSATSGTAATFTLGGGALAAPAITDALNIPARGPITVTGVNDGKIAISIVPTTGVFTGSFISPLTNRRTPFGGVIYQKASPITGDGLYLTGSQAGLIQFSP